MVIFNAIQLVLILVAWPFIISYLDKAEFRGSSAAFWSAIVLYGIQLIWTTVCYVEVMEKK